MARGTQARKRRTARRVAAAGVSKARSNSTTTVLEAAPPEFPGLDALVAAAAAEKSQLAIVGGSFELGDRKEEWDGGAAEKSYELPGDASCYMWRDPDGDPASKGSYKLPFVDEDDGGKHAVWSAITTIAGVLSGSMGGVKGIPDGDVAKIKSKVEGYYAKAAKKYGDDGIEVPWKSSDAAAVLAAADMAKCAECGHAAMAHGGDDNDGACSMKNCSCDGFVEKDKAAADAEELAAKGACAECSHAEADHSGPDGACAVSGCSCGGFEPAKEEASVSMFAIADLNDVVSGLPSSQAALVKLRIAGFEVFADGVADTLPDEHKPGARNPRRRSSPKAPASPAAASGSTEWQAMIVPEGTLTVDGRCMAPGAITWRELPLSLMAMIETTEGGHIGAQLCGRIDRIWRDEAAGVIRAAGVFDDGEYGQEIARLVEDRTLTGVSVDLAIQSWEAGPRSDYFDGDGNWAPKEAAAAAPLDAIDVLLSDDDSDPTVFVVTSAVIGMTTVCPFPAFANAKIDVAQSLVAGANPGFWTCSCQGGYVIQKIAKKLGVELAGAADALTAAAAGIAPNRPPAEWFRDPELTELTPLTITDDGRIYGHAWAWETCHTAFQDACVSPPSSAHDYAYFHLGEVECDDGSRVNCGKITLDTGHADRRLGRADATAHYDNTGVVAADVVVGEDEFGGWFSGSIRADADSEKVRVLRAAALSGDWRQVSVDGGKTASLELTALLAVNVPGFPVPRGPRADVVVASGAPEVKSLVAAGVHAVVAARLVALRDKARAGA